MKCDSAPYNSLEVHITPSRLETSVYAIGRYLRGTDGSWLG